MPDPDPVPTVGHGPGAATTHPRLAGPDPEPPHPVILDSRSCHSERSRRISRQSHATSLLTHPHKYRFHNPMPPHINPNDPDCKTAAAEILRRHNEGQPEANITTAVRDFLTTTGLVKPEHIVEENPPAEGSRRAVDLTALDTFIEFKRRIGTTGGFNPDPKNVDQLDDYLAQSQKDGRVRMGILTDGKHWLLRWPGAGKPKIAPPYAFTLEEPCRRRTNLIRLPRLRSGTQVRGAAKPQSAVPAHPIVTPTCHPERSRGI